MWRTVEGRRVLRPTDRDLKPRASKLQDVARVIKGLGSPESVDIYVSKWRFGVTMLGVNSNIKGAVPIGEVVEALNIEFGRGEYHQVGVQHVGEWILSLATTCPVFWAYTEDRSCYIGRHDPVVAGGTVLYKHSDECPCRHHGVSCSVRPCGDCKGSCPMIRKCTNCGSRWDLNRKPPRPLTLIWTPVHVSNPWSREQET